MKLTKKWLKKNNIPFEEKGGRITVFGSLDLYDTNITSLPKNLVVGGRLDLGCTNITSIPENLVVGGELYLDCSKINSLPDNLVVGGSMNLRRTNITSLPENLVVGCSLDLRDTKIISLPENLVVGGSLALSGTGITSLPKNLVVGGSLDLIRMGILKKEAKKVKKPKGNFENLLSWQNGKYRVIDGIFCEILCKKKNVLKVKTRNKVQFVVTDGERFAHGETIEEARDSLMYKIGERDTSAYEHLNKNSVLTKEEAIKMYRVITGACESGTRHFVEENGDNIKDKMTIAEIIKITEGQYGNEDLKKFFV